MGQMIASFKWSGYLLPQKTKALLKIVTKTHFVAESCHMEFLKTRNREKSSADKFRFETFRPVPFYNYKLSVTILCKELKMKSF